MITGAARGIGHELTRRALLRGDDVFAVVRKEGDRSRFDPSANLHVIIMDVADNGSVTKGFRQLDDLLGGRPLNAIIHAAAISVPNAIEIAPIEEFERTLNTNTLGSLRILQSGIPRLRGHDGRLILLTSLWGKASGPLLGAYCASKHAIESLVDTARRETAGMNLHIVLIEPGVVKTEMLAAQGPDADAAANGMSDSQLRLYGSLYKRYAKLSSGAAKSALTTTDCAMVIEKALTARKPKTRYRAGTDAKIVCFLAWLLPDRWLDRMLALAVNNKPL